MYLGNLMLLLINIFCIPAFASIARVPFQVPAPMIIVLCTLGTFTVHDSIIDVGIMFACGVLGLFMRIFDFSAAALVIALVLGPLAEETLRQTMMIFVWQLRHLPGPNRLQALLALIALLLLIPPLTPMFRKAARTLRGRERQSLSEESADERDRAPA